MIFVCKFICDVRKRRPNPAAPYKSILESDVMGTFRSKNQGEKSAVPNDISERKRRKIDIPRFI